MKGVFGKTLVGRREAFDVHKKEILTTSSRSVSGFFFCALIVEEDEIFYIDEDYNGFSSYDLFLMKK